MTHAGAVQEILWEVEAELGAGFVATHVARLDGQILAARPHDPDVDAGLASAFLAVVMSLSLEVAGQLDMGEVEDSLITTDRTAIVSRLLAGSGCYWELTVVKSTSLGMVRMVMGSYAGRLRQALGMV